MKLNFLETHDRLKDFKQKQNQSIQKGAEDCLKHNPDSLLIQDKSPYLYIFAHPRTHDDGFTKVMYWQPRISRPKSQTNSYCFRAISHTDMLEICWLLPPRELWGQYEKGKITENEYVLWSINQFENHRESLDAPHPEDFPEHKQKEIMQSVLNDIRYEAMMKKQFGIT